MSWAKRRQIIYFVFTVTFVGLVTFGLIHRATSVEPTCFDHKQNGTELGVDCGGSCALYCPDELSGIKVRWQRAFLITPGIAHTVAYVEHNNSLVAARNIKYSFKLFDDKNTLIVEKQGETFLGPMGRTAIIETLIPVGSSVPATVRFSILPPIPWEKIPKAFSNIVIKSSVAKENSENGLRITATLENQSHFTFHDLDVVAIIYDDNDNAITISKSTLSELVGGRQATVYFTWPFNLSKIGRVEIVPRFNPFTATSI